MVHNKEEIDPLRTGWIAAQSNPDHAWYGMTWREVQEYTGVYEILRPYIPGWR